MPLRFEPEAPNLSSNPPFVPMLMLLSLGEIAACFR
jgi:hypothetical protein